MAARPTWQGHLKLSLVTCPVALFTATSSSSDVRFHLINPETNNRIRMVPTDPDTGPVERSDLVRGYEVSRDEYVLFDEADFDRVKLESTRVISIDKFVDESEIDRLYWEDPFYVVPEKGAGVEAFAVIRDAMKKQGKVALGCLVLRGGNPVGLVTSFAVSPSLGRPIALAYVHPDDSAAGTSVTVRARDGAMVDGTVAGHAFFDPENRRQEI